MRWIGIELVESIAAQLALIYWNIEGVCSPACGESLDVSLFERLLGAVGEGC
jgi:hypothetical protein